MHRHESIFDYGRLPCYGRESFVWEFCEIGSVRFPVGSVIHSGVLRELCLKHESETTEYSYCSADWLLYIDRSDYEPDGFVNICINDCCRVERIRGDEYWLYDLEDVEKEPDDYRYRYLQDSHYRSGRSKSLTYKRKEA